MHHSPLPEPSPAREGCDLRGGVQAPPQRAHAARGAAHPRACAGQSPSASSGCLSGWTGVTQWGVKSAAWRWASYGLTET